MPSLVTSAVKLGYINAPSVHSPKQECKLRVDAEVVRSIASRGATVKLFQLFYNVCGYLPPVNNIGAHEKESDSVLNFPDKSFGIMDTHAVFQGINRPFMNHGLDDDVFVYVSCPKYYYTYKADMVCVAERKPLPEELLFAVYVRFDDATCAEGEIVMWEFVVSDDNDRSMPAEYPDRYRLTRWKL